MLPRLLESSSQRSPERRSTPFHMYYGAEFTCKAMFFWTQRTGVRLHFIQPGKPTQNAFVESFNGKFREYCLDLHWLAILNDARATIERWRIHYNHVRHHRSVGKIPHQWVLELGWRSGQISENYRFAATGSSIGVLDAGSVLRFEPTSA